jgi:hypothetical protein
VCTDYARQVLFERRLRDGLSDGSISVAFRRWRKAQVVPGHWYRLGLGAGQVQVTDVRIVEDIGSDEARAAGYASREALLKDMRGDAPMYRVTFGEVQDDPREALRESMNDIDSLEKRIASIAGADQTLRAISEQPGVRAADLARQLGWDELLRFKTHVRRLKALGLTISLEVGYRLSPRGEAYLETRRS